jgi:hypothetical protein
MTRRMKREDEVDEMQGRQMIAGYYRLLLNNPPEKGFMARDRFLGWEGDDGVTNHIQHHFGLDQGSSVNTSGKAGAQIPHLPLGDDSSPSGDNAVCM